MELYFKLNENKDGLIVTGGEDLENILLIPYIHNCGKGTYPVTEIGDFAFHGCSELSSVVIPGFVTEIGLGAFARCSQLVSVFIPDTVTVIGSFAFRDCSSLTSIVIPDSVTEIGKDAFAHCDNLERIVISDVLLLVGTGVPQGVSIIVHQKQVLTHEEKMFDCDDMEYDEEEMEDDFLLKYDEEELAWSHYNENPFFYYKLNQERNGLMVMGQDFNGVAIIIPSEYAYYKVTEIADFGFMLCKNVKKIDIPNTVTKIGKNAFCGCEKLESIIIPDSVTEIGDHAFYGCESLEEIVINDASLLENAGVPEGVKIVKPKKP